MTVCPMTAMQHSDMLRHRISTLKLLLFSCFVLDKLRMTIVFNESVPIAVAELKIAKDILCHFSNSLGVHAVTQSLRRKECILVAVYGFQVEFPPAVCCICLIQGVLKYRYRQNVPLITLIHRF